MKSFSKFPSKFLLLVVNFSVTIASCSAQVKDLNNLVPDVPYVNKVGRTHVFSRSQLIYSLGDRDYLHRWVDRPLYVDPSLDAGKQDSALMTTSGFLKMELTGKEYGLDGFAFFPETSKRSSIYGLAASNAVDDFKLLNEVANANKKSIMSVIKMALANQQSYRINGKVVITSYDADKTRLETWKETLAEIKRMYGDKIIFLPSISFFDSKPLTYWMTRYHNNSLSQSDISGIKDYLRSWARATDGLYFINGSGLIDKRRKFDESFYRNFVIKIMKSVLSEPEFNQKYFGLSAVVGHENATRLGYTLNSEGTKTLRASFEAAADARPDIINIPEWDEQNENTSLEPTVDNGLSSLRLMRYYMSKIRQQPLSPLKNDNTNIPNLTISYRKILVLGEAINIELLNIPDNNNNKPFTAILTLKNNSGETVYTSQSYKFNTNQLTANSIQVPSESLGSGNILIPHLDIVYENRKSSFEKGLHYIELRGTWNWDYKWVKEPLRDLLIPSNMEFNITNNKNETTKTVSSSITTNESLAYLDVLDDDDVEYSYSGDNNKDNLHDDLNQAVITVEWKAFGSKAQGIPLAGTIALQKTKQKWLAAGIRGMALQGQTLSLNGQTASTTKQSLSIAVNKSDIPDASLSVNIPGIYSGNIPVKQIIDNSIFGISGRRGFNLVFSHDSRQETLPDNLNTTTAHFSAQVSPDLRESIFSIQAIAKSGRIYRSNPILANPLSAGKKSITVYSETKMQPITTSVSENLVPDIMYQFDPKYGSILTTLAGRPFWGILGGYSSQATKRGGGRGTDDTPFIHAKDYPETANKSAPDWVKTENGQYALQFDGEGTFVSLPQGVIPRRAAFTIEMDIKADDVSKKQLIIGNRSYIEGSLSVFVENGVLIATFLGENTRVTNLNSRLTLPAGTWVHLSIKYNQSSLTFSVNDQTSRALPLPGPGLYDTATVVGGFGNAWFKGLIKNLHIQHWVN